MVWCVVACPTSDPSGSTMATMGVVSGHSVPAGGQAIATTHGMETPGTAICEEVPSRSEHN